MGEVYHDSVVAKAKKLRADGQGVESEPVRAGIDPYNKLVDRNSDDNVKKVSRTTIAELGAAAGG